MKKEVIIAAALTFAVTALGGYLLTTFEAGSDALTEEQIRKVLKEENVAIIDGQTMTYGEALNKIATEQAVQRQALSALIED